MEHLYLCAEPFDISDASISHDQREEDRIERMTTLKQMKKHYKDIWVSAEDVESIFLVSGLPAVSHKSLAQVLKTPLIHLLIGIPAGKICFQVLILYIEAWSWEIMVFDCDTSSVGITYFIYLSFE